MAEAEHGRMVADDDGAIVEAARRLAESLSVLMAPYGSAWDDSAEVMERLQDLHRVLPKRPTVPWTVLNTSEERQRESVYRALHKMAEDIARGLGMAFHEPTGLLYPPEVPKLIHHEFNPALPDELLRVAGPLAGPLAGPPEGSIPPIRSSLRGLQRAYNSEVNTTKIVDHLIREREIGPKSERVDDGAVVYPLTLDDRAKIQAENRRVRGQKRG